MSKYTAEQVETACEAFEGANHWQFQTEEVKENTRRAMRRSLEAVTLLQKRESAKAGVTDEMVKKAYDIIVTHLAGFGGPLLEGTRAALEAVAPMLASIQPPDMVCEQHPWSEWPHDDCAGPGMPGTAQYEALVYLAKLASARVPDEPTEEMLVAARDWSYRKYGKPIGNDAAIGCWQAMLAAAGEPNHDA